MKRLLYIFALFISITTFSQTLYSVLEKKTIALGEPNVYKIRVDGLAGKTVEVAPKNELLPFHFEEINDSISIQGDIYERTIEFTVFEEGKFTIPAFEVNIGGDISKTIPYELEVINTAQKGDKINDIMKNKGVKMDIANYWEMYKWYILGFLALIALAIAVWMIVKFGRKRKSSPVVATNQALKQLEQLKKKKYIEAGNYRSFYVELIDISRSFLKRQYSIAADVLLTDDLIEVMKRNQTISQANEKIVEDIFLRGDLVKFAKTFPDQSTMEKDYNDIREFVKKSLKDLEFENLRKDV